MGSCGRNSSTTGWCPTEPADGGNEEKVTNVLALGHLLSAVLARPTPPVPDGDREADHEDERVDPEDKHRVLFLHNPGGQTDSKLHCLGPIGVAIVLPAVPGIAEIKWSYRKN